MFSSVSQKKDIDLTWRMLISMVQWHPIIGSFLVSAFKGQVGSLSPLGSLPGTLQQHFLLRSSFVPSQWVMLIGGAPQFIVSEGISPFAEGGQHPQPHLSFLKSNMENIQPIALAAVWTDRSKSHLYRAPFIAPLADQYINVLELHVVHLALRHFLPFLGGKHVVVQTTFQQFIMWTTLCEAQRLLQWASPCLATFSATLLPG